MDKEKFEENLMKLTIHLMSKDDSEGLLLYNNILKDLYDREKEIGKYLGPE